MKLITCPNGHRFRSPPIVYGLPTPEAMQDAEEGRVRLGGCDPTFPAEIVCPVCGLEVSELVSGSPEGPVAEVSDTAF